MRRKYRWDSETQSMVEVGGEYKPKVADVHSVHTDEIEPTESMATDERKMFTSMSALKRHYKEHGYEMTGGDHLTGKAPPKAKANREEIRDALLEAKRQLEWGMAPMSEKEREQCQREEQNYQRYLRNR